MLLGSKVQPAVDVGPVAPFVPSGTVEDCRVRGGHTISGMPGAKPEDSFCRVCGQAIW